MSEDGPEEIQVLTVRGNKLYLPLDVRTVFNLHNEDRVVVYNDKGRMSVKLIRKSRTPVHVNQAKD